MQERLDKEVVEHYFEAAIVGVGTEYVKIVGSALDELKIAVHRDIASEWVIDGKHTGDSRDYEWYESYIIRPIFLWRLSWARQLERLQTIGEVEDPFSSARRKLYFADFREERGGFGDAEQFRVGQWLREMVSRDKILAGNALESPGVFSYV